MIAVVYPREVDSVSYISQHKYIKHQKTGCVLLYMIWDKHFPSSLHIQGTERDNSPNISRNPTEVPCRMVCVEQNPKFSVSTPPNSGNLRGGDQPNPLPHDIDFRSGIRNQKQTELQHMHEALSGTASVARAARADPFVNVPKRMFNNNPSSFCCSIVIVRLHSPFHSILYAAKLSRV